ncbi:MAG: hypothetical protein K0R39_3381 [Symbiobacteriaceae bacterium]|jgi:hypothetical protein|nr:hypothetical protein [Symbiobacteriaceae bacterium]
MLRRKVTSITKDSVQKECDGTRERQADLMVSPLHPAVQLQLVQQALTQKPGRE